MKLVAYNPVTSDKLKQRYLQSFQSSKTEARIDRGPNGTTIHAGGGNDNITVNKNADHSVTVNINGEQHHFTEEEAKTLIVHAGDGHDNVQVLNGADVKVIGGRGIDTISREESNDKGTEATVTRGPNGTTISAGDGDELALTCNIESAIHPHH